MLLSLVLSLGIGSVPSPVVAALAPKSSVDGPKNAKARKHFDKAMELYTAKDYAGAEQEATKGLAIEEHALLLFLLAQSERQQGNCVAAVEHFSRFIELTDSEDMRENALTAKAICAEQLAEEARQAELLDEIEDDIEPSDPVPEPEPTEPEPEPAPWYRDPIGGVLVGVGGAAVLAGGITLIAAAALDPARAPDYGTFVRRREVRPQLVLGGAITAGVGVLLAAGGALRWGLLARKAKASGGDSSHLQVGPWLTRSRAGLSVRLRF